MIDPDAKWRHPVLEKNYSINKHVKELWDYPDGMRGNF